MKYVSTFKAKIGLTDLIIINSRDKNLNSKARTTEPKKF